MCSLMNRNHQPTVLRDQVFRVEKVIHSAGGRKDTSKERGLSFSPPNPRAILGTPPPEPQLLSPPATCDCRPADNMLLATLGARQRVSESRGAPAVPHHFERVGSRRTGCSNSHRFSSPALPRLGCSLPLCLVSLAKFSFRHRGHRTGVHTGANSTPLEGPWTPLQPPYSISRRAGPRNA